MYVHLKIHRLNTTKQYSVALLADILIKHFVLNKVTYVSNSLGHSQIELDSHKITDFLYFLQSAFTTKSNSQHMQVSGRLPFSI